MQFRLDDPVHLHRSGTVDTQLEFNPTAPTKTRYRTQYGVISLTVTTRQLDKEINLNRPAGSLSVDYTLMAGDQLVGNYRLQLQFAS